MSEEEKLVELPLGAIINDNLVRNCTIRKMKAGDRMILGRRENKKKPIQAFTDLITSCTLRFGEGHPASKSIIESLSVCDRDMITLELRRFSLGDSLACTMHCGACKEHIQFDFDLSEIPIQIYDDDFIADNIEIKKGLAYLKCQDEKTGYKAILRFPNADDTEKFLRYMNINQVEGEYRFLEGCLVEWREKEGPFPFNKIQDFGLDEIDAVERLVEKMRVGPDWDTKVACEICGQLFHIDLSSSDFLFKTRS